MKLPRPDARLRGALPWPRAAAAALVLFAATAALAQPKLPPPEATDPVALGLMAGSPPPVAKRISLANILAYPNIRWASHHMRELGPTRAVTRGEQAPRPLPQALSPTLGQVSFEAADGQSRSIDAWLSGGYTDAFLVLHRGRIVMERYAVGMQPQQPHAYWSLSKSVVGLLATQLIHEGVVDAQVPLARLVPELAGSAWADATLQQALDMTTGAAYREVFTDPTAEIHAYLRAAGLQPFPPGVSGPRTLSDYLPSVAKAGEHGQAYRYKSADTEVVAWVLQRVTGQPLDALASQRLWRRLGAEQDAYLWVDAIGTPAGSVGFNATLRDTARLGEMLRNDGRVGSDQVVPEAVVRELRRGADPAKFALGGAPVRAGYSYHNHWWIPHDADGSFEAKGLFGQHLHINPAAELVIVKFSSHPVPDSVFTHVDDRRAYAAIAAALRR